MYSMVLSQAISALQKMAAAGKSDGKFPVSSEPFREDIDALQAMTGASAGQCASNLSRVASILHGAVATAKAAGMMAGVDLIPPYLVSQVANALL